MRANIGPNMLSSAYKKQIKDSISAQVRDSMVNISDRMFLDELATVLFVLNNDFGFGQKRLEKFIVRYSDLHEELRQRYELDPTYDGWICTKKIKEAGIDLDELYSHLRPRYKR